MRSARFFLSMLLLAGFAGLFAVNATAQDTWWVQSADYGSGNRRQDVTNTVRRLVNGPNFRVNNATLGGDPYVGADKVLRIRAKDITGNVRDFTYKEGSMVNAQMFTGGPESGRPGWNKPGYGNGRPNDGYNGYPNGGNNNYNELRITSAKWGTGNRWQDVTERLQSMVRNGRLSVKVDPQSMGGDPAQGASKTLQVRYHYRGQKNNKTVPEGATLNLP